MCKNRCGHCVSYDLWCGVCLNPESESFKADKELISEDAACGLFNEEMSFSAHREAVEDCCKAAYTWAITNIGNSRMAEELCNFIKSKCDG